ncbi:transcription factor TFIIE beta subunit, TFIIEB, Tfa2, partial [Spiromyces aspiralis]
METAQTPDQIQMMTGILIRDNPVILEQLTNNEKIIYDEETDTFAYKPAYDLRTNEDLLRLLEKHKDKCGLRVIDLKDSFLDIIKAAE